MKRVDPINLPWRGSVWCRASLASFSEMGQLRVCEIVSHCESLCVVPTGPLQNFSSNKGIKPGFSFNLV